MQVPTTGNITFNVLTHYDPRVQLNDSTLIYINAGEWIIIVTIRRNSSEFQALKQKILVNMGIYQISISRLFYFNFRCDPKSKWCKMDRHLSGIWRHIDVYSISIPGLLCLGRWTWNKYKTTHCLHSPWCDIIQQNWSRCIKYQLIYI